MEFSLNKLPDFKCNIKVFDGILMEMQKIKPTLNLSIYIWCLINMIYEIESEKLNLMVIF